MFHAVSFNAVVWWQETLPLSGSQTQLINIDPTFGRHMGKSFPAVHHEITFKFFTHLGPKGPALKLVSKSNARFFSSS